MELEERARLLDELATLLDAGSTPIRAFQVLKRPYAPGTPVSRAVGPLLDGYHARLLEAAEVAGGLEEALKAVAEDLRFRLAMKRKIQGGLAYPVCLVYAGILIPPIGALIFDSTSAYARAVLPSLVVAHLLAFLLWRFWAGMRAWGEAVPLLGTPLRRLAEARLLQTLALTVRSGLPIADCLSLSAEASGNRLWLPFGKGAAGRIANGAKVHEVLKYFPSFPGEIACQVMVAEEGGTLDESLPRMAKAARAEAEIAIEDSAKRFETASQWLAMAFAALQILALGARVL